VRIAIVNDMRTAIEALRRVLVSIPNFQVAWVAVDGEEAVRKCVEDPPDLVMMDLYMPGMDGVEATSQIMMKRPCPILVVTASVEGHASKVFSALGAGALDAVRTPIWGASGQAEGAGQLRVKIEAIGRMVSEGRTLAGSESVSPARSPDAAFAKKILAIGASAGGPAAIATVLGALPATFAAAVVIVQHIDVQFAASMTEWLGKSSILPVQVASDGDPLRDGIAYVAASNDHLVLRSSRTLGYTSEPKASYYRPSVDVFFESVSRHWSGDATAVLLTGMGRDGARGLKTLRSSGAYTIAQDQASSVVYGMPKAAAELDAAIEILPLSQIAPRVCAIVAGRHPRARDKHWET
jgi:two-component system response regulator WspF